MTLGYANLSPKISLLIGVAGFGVGVWAGYMHGKGGNISHGAPEMDAFLLSIIPFLSGAYGMIGAGMRQHIYTQQLNNQREEVESVLRPKEISKMEEIVENKDHAIEKGIKSLSISGVATLGGYGIGRLVSIF